MKYKNDRVQKNFDSCVPYIEIKRFMIEKELQIVQRAIELPVDKNLS